MRLLRRGWGMVLFGCIAFFGCEPMRQGAPEYLTVEPVPPRVGGYPEFYQTDRAREKPPALPPLPQYGRGDFYRGVQPLDVATGREGPPHTWPLRTGGLHPDGPMPVEQLIFGGPYPERDAPPPYRFHPGDQIRLTVMDHPEFDGIVEVREDGTIPIPNTQDEVRAEGREPYEVADAIRNVIRPYVQGEPVVRVGIHLAVGGIYTIFGQVLAPGRYPLGDRPLRLSEAIFRACSKRWLSEFTSDRTTALREELREGPRSDFVLPPKADLEEVIVITPHRSHPIRKTYSIRQALFEGKRGEDPLIQDGQIICIGKSGLADFLKRHPLGSSSMKKEEIERADPPRQPSSRRQEDPLGWLLHSSNGR